MGNQQEPTVEMKQYIMENSCNDIITEGSFYCYRFAVIMKKVYNLYLYTFLPIFFHSIFTNGLYFISETYSVLLNLFLVLFYTSIF